MELNSNDIELELIGIDWGDVNPKIIEFILKLIDERKLKGKTYIGISISFGEFPIPYRQDEIVDGIVYSVQNLDCSRDFLEYCRKYYSMDHNVEFDNAVTVTVGNSNDYVINTILFNAKDDYFMIRLGYPKVKGSKLDYNQMTKKLK